MYCIYTKNTRNSGQKRLPFGERTSRSLHYRGIGIRYWILPGKGGCGNVQQRRAKTASKNKWHFTSNGQYRRIVLRIENR
jgi:hypothetical protein